MKSTWAVLATGLIVAVGAACSSSSAISHQVNPTPSLPRRTAAALSFREVEHVAQAQNRRCAGARRGEIVLPDRLQQHCYVLGPSLVGRGNIEGTAVVYDDTTSQWLVNVHFRDDQFLTKVARPLVGKTVAIVVDDVVQSAPVIHEGIAGRDIEISSQLSERDAVALAASLRGVDPSDVRVETNSG